MSGKINLSQIACLAVTRSRVIYGAPCSGKINRDHALSSLADSYGRVKRAMMVRIGMTEREFGGLSVSRCGGYVTVERLTR